MPIEGIITKSAEASQGAFKSIIRIGGILESIKRIPPPAGRKSDYKAAPDDQAEITLKDAKVIEMVPGEPEPKLKDGRYTTWMDYAPKGQVKPTAQKWFVQFFVKSAQALDLKRQGKLTKPFDVDKTPAKEVAEGDLAALMGTYIVLVRHEYTYHMKDKETQQEKDVVKSEYIVDLTEGTDDPADIKGYISALADGKAAPAVIRDLTMDSKSQRYPEFVEALKAGDIDKFCALTGMTYVDERFVKGS